MRGRVRRARRGDPAVDAASGSSTNGRRMPVTSTPWRIGRHLSIVMPRCTPAASSTARRTRSAGGLHGVGLSVVNSLSTPSTSRFAGTATCGRRATSAARRLAGAAGQATTRPGLRRCSRSRPSTMLRVDRGVLTRPLQAGCKSTDSQRGLRMLAGPTSGPPMFVSDDGRHPGRRPSPRVVKPPRWSTSTTGGIPTSCC